MAPSGLSDAADPRRVADAMGRGRRLSGGGAVLVDEPAAGSASFDRPAWCDRDDVLIVGCALVEGSVRAMRVVVLDVVDEQRPKLALVPHKGSIQEFVANGSDRPLGERVRLRPRGGVVMAVIPMAVNTESNEPEYWPAPSWTTNRNPSSRSMRRFRAAWVVHAPVGFVVIPPEHAKDKVEEVVDKTKYALHHK